MEIEEDGDFVVNEKDKVVNLTLEGVKKVEQFSILITLQIRIILRFSIISF